MSDKPVFDTIREWLMTCGIPYFSLYEYHPLTGGAESVKPGWYVRRLIWISRETGSTEIRWKTNREKLAGSGKGDTSVLQPELGDNLKILTLVCVPALSDHTDGKKGPSLSVTRPV